MCQQSGEDLFACSSELSQSRTGQVGCFWQLRNVGKTIKHPVGNGNHTTYKKADNWGMLQMALFYPHYSDWAVFNTVSPPFILGFTFWQSQKNIGWYNPWTEKYDESWDWKKPGTTSPRWFDRACRLTGTTTFEKTRSCQVYPPTMQDGNGKYPARGDMNRNLPLESIGDMIFIENLHSGSIFHCHTWLPVISMSNSKRGHQKPFFDTNQACFPDFDSVKSPHPENPRTPNCTWLPFNPNPIESNSGSCLHIGCI